EVMVDLVEELVDHPVPDLLALYFAEFEVARADEPILLVFGQAVPEHRRLREVVLEALAALPNLSSVYLLHVVDVAARRLGGRHRAAVAERVRGIIDPALVDG